MQNNLYQEKSKQYYNELRSDLISLIEDQKNLNVLEIGCGNGVTARYLKEHGIAQKIFGIDLIECENKEIFDDFIMGNIETTQLPYEHNFFDLIIAGDVLEHLIDPWAVIKKLKHYLKQDGLFIASIPNIRNYNVLKNLILKKEFKYEDAGILDKTHLRFFTRKSIVNMFKEDFNLIEIKIRKDPLERHHYIIYMFDRDLFAVQYLIKAKNNKQKV